MHIVMNMGRVTCLSPYFNLTGAQRAHPTILGNSFRERTVYLV